MYRLFVTVFNDAVYDYVSSTNYPHARLQDLKAIRATVRDLVDDFLEDSGFTGGTLRIQLQHDSEGRLLRFVVEEITEQTPQWIIDGDIEWNEHEIVRIAYTDTGTTVSITEFESQAEAYKVVVMILEGLLYLSQKYQEYYEVVERD